MRWIGEYFVFWLCFGLAIWAIVEDEFPTAQFFLLMGSLSAISVDVADVKRRVKRLERDEAWTP